MSKTYLNDYYVPSIGLLEFLQKQVGCIYVSDLHIPSNLPLIKSALRKIEPDIYGLREWDDAVCYLTGQDSNFENQRDAAKYLMKWNGRALGNGLENSVCQKRIIKQNTTHKEKALFQR